MLRRISSFALLLQFGFCAQPVIGAEDAAESSSVVTYDKEYFTKFKAVTLLDMLSRIPGVQEILDKSRQQQEQAAVFGASGGQRGFGSGGDQILIDGKRLAGKDNNINDTLARVSAENVLEVQLIRGAAAGLDVQSQGLVINIILTKGVSKSSTFWKVGALANIGDEVGHIVTVSHSGSAEALDYSFTVDSQRTFRVSNRDEEFTYANTDVISRTRVGRAPNRKDNHKLSANIDYTFEDGGLLRINGLYNPEIQHDIETRALSFLDESIGPPISVVDDSLDADGNRKLSEVWRNDGTPTKYEIGGDYSRGLGSLGSLKTLFVYNKEKSDISKSFTKGEGSSEFLYQQQNSKLDKSEAIFRGSVTKGVASGQSLEIGGEAALNKFNRSFQNRKTAAKGDPLLLNSNDDVKIKESRFEIFANHSYTISPAISLTSSLTAEFSKIVADNFFTNGTSSRNEASFTFLKPRMNFRYDVTAQDQVRLLVERTVSQLDFNNFATSFNALTEKIDTGNTSIKPMRSWDFSATYEHRFSQDSGSVSLEVFYKKYTDYIDKVDFTNYADALGNAITADQYFALPSAEQTLVKDDFISKSGNVPTSKSVGFKFKSSYRLGIIGLKEAVLSFNFDYEKSTLPDPFTDREIQHSFKPAKQINFAYRHDVTNLGISYGGSVTLRRGFHANDIRLNWYGTPGTLAEIFVEKNIYNGIKLRVAGKGLSGTLGDSNQFIYNNHVRFNDLNREVHRHTRGPHIIEATLQGTF